MAFKPVFNTKPLAASQANGLKPNPNPGGNHPRWIPCPDCKKTGRKEYLTETPNGKVYEEDDCKLCAGQGWVGS